MPVKTSVFNAGLIAGEALPFEFDWTHEFANRWSANRAYAASSRLRPSTPELQTGFEYESSGGQSGPNEPEWPQVEGLPVDDGSITWTARALSNASLRERIQSATWPEVTNFTIDTETEIDEPGRQLTSAQISSETESATRREIRCEVSTTGSNIYVGILKMKVE